MSNYAVKACGKVRGEASLATGIQVFLATNRFREDLPQYANSGTLAFDEPTDDPIRVVVNAKILLRSIYREGFAYKKAGIILLDLVSNKWRQGLLFEEHGSENHGPSRRRVCMGIRQPSVERKHGHFHSETQEERQKNPPLQVERHVQRVELGYIEGIHSRHFMVVEVDGENAE